MQHDHALTPQTSASLEPQRGLPSFDYLIETIAAEDGSGMVAATTARVYRDTYARWQSWCDDHDIAPDALNYDTVRRYLADLTSDDGQPQSKSSKQRHLAALRTLSQLLTIIDFDNPERKAAHDSLKLLKLRHTGVSGKQSRARRSLTPAEAHRVLHIWDSLPPEDSTPAPIALRNQAIIAVLLQSGIRRAELTAMRWEHVDFARGIVHIPHGKGDKPREVALYGETALKALRAWRAAQPEGCDWVFTSFADRGGSFGPDAPLTTTSIYRIVRRTGELAGVGHFAPHDARRTLLTEMSATGSTIYEIAGQAGHSSLNSSKPYVKVADAEARRKQGRIRYD